MMPIDTRVIRYRANDDDRTAARHLLGVLIAAETTGDHDVTDAARSAPLVLTPALNKMLQNALSVLVRNRPVSVIVLDDEELLDVGTTAEILGFGAVWVSKMVKEGKIAPHKHKAGRKYLIPGHAVVDHIERDPAAHARRVASRTRVRE